MNPIIPAVLLGLSGVLFFTAGCLALKPARASSERGGWILALLANLFLTGWAGFWTYQLVFSPNPADLMELILAILADFAATLECVGIVVWGNRFIRMETNRKSLAEDSQRYRLSLEKSPQFLVIKDRQGAYQYANPAFVQFLGKKDQELIGETDFKFFPRAQASALRVEEEKALDSGTTRTRDEEIRGIQGPRWLRTSRVPLVDEKQALQGLLIASVDITAQKQVEAVLQGLKNELAVLDAASQALTAPADSASVWERITDWSGKITRSDTIGIWQVFPERSSAVLTIGCGKLGGFANLQLRAGEDIVWKVWQSGNAELVQEYASWPGRSQKLRELNFTAVIAAPIRIKEQIAYVIAAYSDTPGVLFREEQLQLLKVFSADAAAQLEQIERSSSNQSELEEWKRKQDSAIYRMRLEHIVAVIAAHFINPDLEKIDEGITRSLQTLAKFAGLERGYLVLFSKGNAREIAQPGWYGSGVGPDIVNDCTRDDFQWYLAKINQLEVIHLPRVKDLAGEQEDAAGYFKAKGLRSFSAIPLVENRAAIGYLGFEALRSELEWSADVLGLFKVCAEMFVSLLERKGSAKEVKDQIDRANQQIAALEQRNQESGLLTEMGDLLQACRTSDEAYPIIVRYLKRLIPFASGGLYMTHDPKDPAEKVAAWGNDQPGPGEHELGLNECWSLRRGRLYAVQDPASEPVCGHIKVPLEKGYLCVPLIAQGVAVGVLHLRLPTGLAGEVKFSEGQQHLAAKIGEYIAVPLTNLKLRDDLRSQAIRDPLTKLFNRRYMEETLDREIRRASRHSTSVGIIMFDIDKMKPINDRFGHDAGDLVLRSLGHELLSQFRGEDVACRYGGDEFTIVLPEASLADVWHRAEQMREAIKRLDLRYDGKPLGALTVSIGVAAYPDHGLTAEKVLLACDAASYASKSEGGDRIMMGHKVEG